jgi:riboflavin kinase / FMN adenylyltransferase
MKIYNSLQEVANNIVALNIAVLFGNFDGFHRGHAFLVERFLLYCTRNHFYPLVVTFSPHPMEYIKSIEGYRLTLDQEKFSKMSQAGIQDLLVLNFDEKIRNITGNEFLDDFMNFNIPISAFYLGHDFALGNNKDFGIEQMRKYCGENIKVFTDEAYSLNGENVSSSAIRRFLLSGNVQGANNYLGYAYKIQGIVVHGNKIGTKLGFPTANIEVDKQKLKPMSGVYHVRVQYRDKYYQGLMNIGIRPTVNSNKSITLEVHIVDFSNQIYAESVTIEFISQLRREVKFDNFEDLKKQITRDFQSIIREKYELRLGLIGKNIKHSKSPQTYSYLLNGFPLNYELIEIENEEHLNEQTLIHYLSGCDGISITSPYKKLVRHFISQIELKTDIDAINAVKMINGEIIGTNTDYLACHDLLTSYMISNTQMVFILGDGAMAEIIMKILKEKGYRFCQFSRRLNNMDQVKEQLSRLSNEHVLIVNCCSREFIFSPPEMKNYDFWDMNYSMPEHEYKFYINKIKYYSGIELLVLQARYALSFWNLKTL